MRQIDVANRHCRYRLRTQPGGQISRHFRHGLIRNVHQKANGLSWLQPEVARDETVPVRIDEVARYVFPQGKRRMPPQLPVAKTRVVLWSLVRPNYPAVVQSVAGQETLGSQHAVGIRVVKALGAPSLARIISPFEKCGVNMTWIESFPIPGPRDGEQDSNPSYLFFLDVEGHVTDEPIQKAMEAARKRCERLDILGSYPRSACIES